MCYNRKISWQLPQTGDWRVLCKSPGTTMRVTLTSESSLKCWLRCAQNPLRVEGVPAFSENSWWRTPSCSINFWDNRYLHPSMHSFTHSFMYLLIYRIRCQALGYILRTIRGGFQYISQQDIGSWRPCWTFCWRSPTPGPSVNPLVAL